MKESPTEISITVGFVLTLDLSGKHPLDSLADFLTEQHFESTLLKAMVESLNEDLVEAYCGEKHAQGNETSGINAQRSRIAQ